MVNKLLILGFFIMGSATSAESSAIEDDLTILSWNIKMFSAPYGWLHNRKKILFNHSKIQLIMMSFYFRKPFPQKFVSRSIEDSNCFIPTK